MSSNLDPIHVELQVRELLSLLQRLQKVGIREASGKQLESMLTEQCTLMSQRVLNQS
jgi:hypothetical protein